VSTHNSFFEESREQSRVKSAIVAKYFEAWARVIIGAQNRYRRNDDHRIAYIDLFAGPGRFSDGTTSTPLLVLEKAIQDEVMRQRLVTIFGSAQEFGRTPDRREFRISSAACQAATRKTRRFPEATGRVWHSDFAKNRPEFLRRAR